MVLQKKRCAASCAPNSLPGGTPNASPSHSAHSENQGAHCRCPLRLKSKRRKSVNLEMDRPFEKSGGRMPRGESLANTKGDGARHLARRSLRRAPARRIGGANLGNPRHVDSVDSNLKAGSGGLRLGYSTFRRSFRCSFVHMFLFVAPATNIY